MYIFIKDRGYSVESPEDVRSLLQQFPSFRENIFEQMGSGERYTMFETSISFLDMIKLFPEKEDKFFQTIKSLVEKKYLVVGTPGPKNYGFIETMKPLAERRSSRVDVPAPKNYARTLKFGFDLFPNRKLAYLKFFLGTFQVNTQLLNCLYALSNVPKGEEWNELLTNFLSDPSILIDYISLYILMTMFPEKEQQIFNYVFKNPENATKLITNFKDLQDAIEVLPPHYKEILFDIFIANPTHFKRLIVNKSQLLAVTEVLFPKYVGLTQNYVYQTLHLIKQGWAVKQKQERNGIRKTYTQLELLGKNNHSFFSRAPQEIKYYIASLTANPIIHDVDEYNKLSMQFNHSKK